MKVIDGVVPMVRRIRYIYFDMTFEVTFFDGTTCRFCAEALCPSIGIMQHQPSRMQLLEAENAVTKIAEEHWREVTGRDTCHNPVS